MFLARSSLPGPGWRPVGHRSEVRGAGPKSGLSTARVRAYVGNGTVVAGLAAPWAMARVPQSKGCWGAPRRNPFPAPECSPPPGVADPGSGAARACGEQTPMLFPLWVPGMGLGASSPPCLLPSLTTGFSQGPPSVWARSPSLAPLPRSRPHTGGESTCCQLLTVQLLLPEQEHQVLVGGWPVRTSLPCAHWGAAVAGDLSLVRPRPGHLGAQMKLPLSVRLGQMTSPRARVCFPWSDTQASHFPLPAPAPAFKAGTSALPLSNPISLCVIQLYGSRCVTDF